MSIGRPRVDAMDVTACTIPTEAPESDATLEWDSTTIVVVEAHSGATTGIGYTYADAAAGQVVHGVLTDSVVGQDAMATGACWERMLLAVRNKGRAGVVANAISAVDNALWDLRARLLGTSLVDLLGPRREEVAIYGSGGFTSLSPDELVAQLGGWAERGIGQVKMKVGRDPAADPQRVALVRDAVGPDVALMVDANGGYHRKDALAQAQRFAEEDVVWIEEPVSSDDVAGLRLVRDEGPAGMDVAAGEYGYDSFHFRRLLKAGAVDVLQADITRCLGLTGFLEAAALSHAHCVPLSAHCAPAQHLHVCAAVPGFRHLEWFADHVRIERMLFDGAVEPDGSVLRPERSRPGNGLVLKRADAERYAA